MKNCQTVKTAVIFSVLFVFFLLAPFHCWAVEPTEPTDEMPGNVAYLDPAKGTAENYTYTGAFTYKIGFAVPPGRLGVAPKLELIYNSQQRNGAFGVGWSMEIGSIQRNTVFGLNYSSSSEDFVYVESGSTTPLVKIGTTEYRLKVDDGRFMRFYNKGTSGWQVFDKNGMVYLFGPDTASRQDNPNDNKQIFKWLLQKATDSNGNYMTATYDKGDNSGQIYLTRIDYTGNGSLPTSNFVEFKYEDRTDKYPVYNTYFSVTTAKRLVYVNSYANGQLASSYEMEYTDSGDTGRSLLTTIRTLGSGGGEMPQKNFKYQTRATGSWPTSKMTIFRDGKHWVENGETIYKTWYSSKEKVRSMDVNGDGKHDVVMGPDEHGNWFGLISTGHSFTPMTLATGAYKEWYDKGHLMRVMDIDGDGRHDILLGPNSSSYYGTKGCWFGLMATGIMSEKNVFNAVGSLGCLSEPDWSNHSTRIRSADLSGYGLADMLLGPTGASKPGDWYGVITPETKPGAAITLPVERQLTESQDYAKASDHPERIRLLDINGDGKQDVLLGPDDYGRWYLLKSNGYDFDDKGQILNQDEKWYNYPNLIRIMDLNGDGLSDVVYGPTPSNGWWKALISTGSGFVGIDELIRGAHPGFADAPQRIRVMDFNGDGLQDILLGPSGEGEWHLLLSTGTGFVLKDGIFINGAYKDFANHSRRVAIMDVNGDGLPDIVMGPTADGHWYVVESAGPYPDLMSSVDNGRGAITDVTYRPSSDYVNTNLPFVVNTVESITVTVDGDTANRSVRNYTYGNGFYERKLREFRGFEYVRQTNPDQSTEETWYHQDEVFKGRPFQTKIRKPWTGDKPGNLLKKTETVWEKSKVGQNSYPVFVRAAQKSVTYFTGSLVRFDDNGNPICAFSGDIASCPYTEEVYTYDESNGNLLTRTILGTNAGSSTTTYKYANYGTWLWRNTKMTLTDDATNTVVRCTLYKYTTGTRAGNLESVTEGCGSIPTKSMTYDDTNGNLKTVKDARRNLEMNITDYDPTATYPKRTENALKHAILTEYDSRFGKLSKITDANINVTTYKYDPFGRIVSKVTPEGTDSSYYNIWNQIYYDGLGRTLQTMEHGISGLYVITRSYYDNMGRQDIWQGPFFSSAYKYPQTPKEGTAYPLTRIKFDFLGNPENIATQEGETIIEYNGLYKTVTDPDGHKKAERRDHLGRLVEVQQQNDAGKLYVAAKYEYNAAGDLTLVTDYNGKETVMLYNILGQKYQMTDPNMGIWYYTYDPNGNLHSQTNANGQTTTFTYDELNRVTLKEYTTADTNYPVNMTNVTYTYDPTVPNGVGRLDTVTNVKVITSYGSYDYAGRVLAQTETIEGSPASKGYLTQTSYDGLGRPATITYPDNYKVTNTYYTGTSLLRSVAGSDGTSATINEYSPSGKIEKITYGNGVTADYIYDYWTTRLANIDVKHGSEVILNKSYVYSAAGDIMRISDNKNVVVYDYTYDSLHRLKTEDSGGMYSSLAFNYSIMGNIMSKTDGTTAMTYAYDPAHIYAVNKITVGSKSYAFINDNNGNMTQGYDMTNPAAPALRTLKYNAENKPVEIYHAVNGTTNILYDGDGGRARKIGPTKTTWYIGQHFEVDSFNGQTNYFNPTARYLFAGNVRFAKVKGEEDSNLAFYNHGDHLNSSSVITDKNGVVQEATTYKPFGEMRTHTPTGVLRSNYKFTDQELDPETGLYYYGARYYDPTIGRFISPDTIVPDYSDPQSLNRYSYVRNNPLGYIDPDGHEDYDAGMVVYIGQNIGNSNSFNVNFLGLNINVIVEFMNNFTLTGQLQKNAPQIVHGAANRIDSVFEGKDNLLRLLGAHEVDIRGANSYLPFMAVSAGMRRLSKASERKLAALAVDAKAAESAKGLIGKDFESFLNRQLGGNGSFKVGGREFDGGSGTRWWEAKSGQYWDMIENNAKEMAYFKSTMGERLSIARQNGATFELHSNTPIPSGIQEWLKRKGIPYTEWK
jgi:RHS repeat-associated protein